MKRVLTNEWLSYTLTDNQRFMKFTNDQKKHTEIVGPIRTHKDGRLKLNIGQSRLMETSSQLH